MKKIIVSILIFLICIFSSVQAESDLKSYIDQMKEYGTELFPEIEEEDFIESLTTGKVKIDSKTFIDRILNLFIKEIKNSLKLMFKILAICIFCGIIKSIQASSENGVSEVAFYVCYLMIAILIITSFMQVVSLTKDTIKSLNAFMGIIIPIIIIYLTISRQYSNSKLASTGTAWNDSNYKQLSFCTFNPTCFNINRFNISQQYFK